MVQVNVWGCKALVGHAYARDFVIYTERETAAEAAASTAAEGTSQQDGNAAASSSVQGSSSSSPSDLRLRAPSLDMKDLWLKDLAGLAAHSAQAWQESESMRAGAAGENGEGSSNDGGGADDDSSTSKGGVSSFLARSLARAGVPVGEDGVSPSTGEGEGAATKVSSPRPLSLESAARRASATDEDYAVAAAAAAAAAASAEFSSRPKVSFLNPFSGGTGLPWSVQSSSSSSTPSVAVAAAAAVAAESAGGKQPTSTNMSANASLASSSSNIITSKRDSGPSAAPSALQPANWFAGLTKRS